MHLQQICQESTNFDPFLNQLMVMEKLHVFLDHRGKEAKRTNFLLISQKVSGG